jgi:GMP synthase (glutamine-hydrolysing)
MKLPTILIIKTGSTYKDLRRILGDFDDWIKAATSEEVTWKVKTIAEIEPPKIPWYQGIIISGSHNSLCFPYPYLAGFRRVVDQIQQHHIPTLGICFGHQLLHKCLGGEVGRNPLGLELGISPIQLTLDGVVDPIFKNIKKVKVEVFSSHFDNVIKPAPDTISLAWNYFSEYQATRISTYIYTVQFHPEYNRSIMAAYIKRNWAELAEQHRRNPLQIASPEAILAHNRDLRLSRLILRNFIDIVRMV